MRYFFFYRIIIQYSENAELFHTAHVLGIRQFYASYAFLIKKDSEIHYYFPRRWQKQRLIDHFWRNHALLNRFSNRKKFIIVFKFNICADRLSIIIFLTYFFIS